MKTRLILMDTATAKEALIARYVDMLNKGIPVGSLPPFRRWVELLANDMKISSANLMEETRRAAMERIKLQSQS